MLKTILKAVEVITRKAAVTAAGTASLGGLYQPKEPAILHEFKD